MEKRSEDKADIRRYLEGCRPTRGARSTMGKTGEEGEMDDVEDERNDDDESNSASDSSELATRMPPEPKGSPMAAALNPSASSVVVMVHLLCPDMELSIADNPRWHINCMNLLQNSVHTDRTHPQRNTIQAGTSISFHRTTRPQHILNASVTPFPVTNFISHVFRHRTQCDVCIIFTTYLPPDAQVPDCSSASFSHSHKGP